MGDIAVILNPASGSGDPEPAIQKITQLFAARHAAATVTSAIGGRALRAAADAAVQGGCRILVAAGGDGTVNAVAGAVVGRDVRFGVLPLGTLNHFAKDLGIPLDLTEAVGVVLDGALHAVDLGEVNGRIFLNNSSIGVYPRIVELRNRSSGRGLAKWAAALWATLAVLRRRPFLGVRIETPDQAVVRRTPFVFVGNNEYQMTGLRAASRPSLSGGHLAVYVMNASGRRGLLQLAWQVFWRGADRAGELDRLLVEEATVETRRRTLQVALDGEVIALASPLRYRTLPAAIRVTVP
ncbi:MAG: diacylglycerol/lipid kinase family protein [Gemmatimonadales bacterium]